MKTSKSSIFNSISSKLLNTIMKGKSFKLESGKLSVTNQVRKKLLNI